jgi:hypothetical protein
VSPCPLAVKNMLKWEIIKTEITKMTSVSGGPVYPESQTNSRPFGYYGREIGIQINAKIQ